MKLVPVDSLVPYEKNAKLHPESQIKALAEIIERFGFRQPILVDDKNVIIAGHGRLLAAQRLGMDKVPVIVASDLSPAEVKALRIADNKIAETDWDDELLRQELLDLMESDSELLALTAHDEKEIEQLLNPKTKNVNFDARELDESDFQDFDHTCPKCGFEFDDE